VTGNQEGDLMQEKKAKEEIDFATTQGKQFSKKGVRQGKGALWYSVTKIAARTLCQLQLPPIIRTGTVCPNQMPLTNAATAPLVHFFLSFFHCAPGSLYSILFPRPL
jgi:hypothetical protein